MTFRNFFLALLFINLLVTSHSQGFYGEWKIDHLITYSPKSEYVLTPLDTTVRYDYGNRINMKVDHSFQTSYSAWCGNDCFTTSMGKFTFLDENYVQFRIDTVFRHGDCRGIPDSVSFPINSEVFFVYQGKENTKFIKTKGDLEIDRREAVYADSIEMNYWESTQFARLFKWVAPEKKLEVSPENIAECYRSANEISDLTVLSSRRMARDVIVVLVEIDGEYQYLFCRPEYTRDEEIIKEIAIYDGQFMEGINNSVAGIEGRLDRFKIEKIKNQTEFGEEVNKIYRKNGKIQKVVIEKKYENGSHRIDYYFENEASIFIRSISDLIDVRSKKKHYSEIEFFITGEDRFIAKGERNVNSSTCEQGFHLVMRYLNGLLKDE